MPSAPMISTCLCASCFIVKGSSGERQFLFKELNCLFPTQNYNRLFVTISFTGCTNDYHVTGGEKKKKIMTKNKSQ